MVDDFTCFRIFFEMAMCEFEYACCSLIDSVYRTMIDNQINWIQKIIIGELCIYEYLLINGLNLVYGS